MIFSAASYWENRYKSGRNSGPGSYGRLAKHKAEVLNQFVHEQRILSVIEFGCGDGAQLGLAQYPLYVGVDVSLKAIDLCRAKYSGEPSKAFCLLGDHPKTEFDLSLSLDVVYHLTDGLIYQEHMFELFRASKRFVIIYASDEDVPEAAPHVRRQRFTPWVSKNIANWKLISIIKNNYPFDPDDPDNTSYSNFHIYSKTAEKLIS